MDSWEGGSGEGLYVKDWHLMAGIEREGGGVEEVYEVPECFRGEQSRCLGNIADCAR